MSKRPIWFRKGHILSSNALKVNEPQDQPPAQNLYRFLAQALKDHGSRLAIIDDQRLLTYSQVGQRVDALAGSLAGRGLDPGDRIAVLLPNSLEFFESYYAAPRAGLILVPLNTRLNTRELAVILQDSGARVLLTRGDLLPQIVQLLDLESPLEGLILVDEASVSTAQQALVGTAKTHLWVSSYAQALSNSSPDAPKSYQRDDHPDLASTNEVAQLYYTSGTTGRPKGVILTHANVSIHARAAIDELRMALDDVWGHFAPMFHLADAWATFAVTAVGGQHVMLPRFEAYEALRLIETRQVTLTNLVPTMLNLMVKHPRVREFDHSSLRLLLSGGAPIAPELVRQTLATFGCDYAQTYGLTETSPYLTLSLLPEHLLKLSAEEQLVYKARTGRPFRSVELRVVDDQGCQVADDDLQVGEIQVRGPTVTPGYWTRRDPVSRSSTRGSASASAALAEVAFEGPHGSSPFTPDGWLRTGDLATIDGEGFVNIVDRAKDMIITGGENVYSLEVEFALYEHPAILEAAAFGLPDELWGEQVAAAVVLRSGEELDEDQLVDFTRQRLSTFKVPRSIFFIDELPKTGSGKILKMELRERFLSSQESPSGEIIELRWRQLGKM